MSVTGKTYLVCVIVIVFKELTDITILCCMYMYHIEMCLAGVIAIKKSFIY